MLIHEFLEESASSRPGATALVHGDERTSYAELERASRRAAGALRRAGVRPGDRVGLLAANSRLYVEAYYGVLMSGGVAVPLHASADEGTVGRALADCGARALIAGGELRRVAREAAAHAGIRSVFVAGNPPEGSAGPVADIPWEEALSIEAHDLPSVPRDAADRAMIVYTSGSTGRARGAVLRHENVVANTRSIVSYLELSSGDRALVVLPFPYVYGKSVLNTHIAVGGTVIIENRFLYPQVVLDTLEREAATGFAGVPSTFAILLNRTNLARRVLPSLRYVTQAGGAMAPELLRRLIDALPGKRIFVMYGATEASARLTYLPPEDLPRKVGSVGRAIPGVSVQVLNPDGSRARTGEMGEIVASGPNVMEGYWGDPEETARVLGPEGLRTGDLGWLDAEGYLWIAGRSREMIKSGGHRLHPKEVEDVLYEHPSVHEAAVVGVDDELLGQALKAYVVAKAGAVLDTEHLREFAARRLPSYKVPKSVEVVDDLPKSAAGKIMRRELH